MKAETIKRLYASILLVLSPIFFPKNSDGGMVVQACFSPERKCSSYILSEIEKAQKEILAALYAFTHQDVADALIKARRRGVQVNVLLDSEFDRGNESSKGKYLERAGIEVRRISGEKRVPVEKDSGLMHQKFAVIDGRVLLSGSYNWTLSADRSNHENLLLFHDAEPLAREYRQEFFRLWEKRP